MKKPLTTGIFLVAFTISFSATADGGLDNLKGDWQSYRQTGKKLSDGSPESLWHMQVATVSGDQMILNVPHEGSLEQQYQAGDIIAKDIRFLGTRDIPARPTHGFSTTGKPASPVQLIGRYFAYIVSMLPLCFGFFWVAFDKRKQGWHDKLAGTVVIKKINTDVSNLVNPNSHVTPNSEIQEQVRKRPNVRRFFLLWTMAVQ